MLSPIVSYSWLSLVGGSDSPHFTNQLAHIHPAACKVVRKQKSAKKIRHEDCLSYLKWPEHYHIALDTLEKPFKG